MAYTVKVSNVSEKAVAEDLEALFSGCGQIESVDLGSDGADSQIAFVTFQTQDATKSALLLSGSKIKDKEVHVSELTTYNDGASNNNQGSRIKVNNTLLGSFMGRVTKGIVSKSNAQPEDQQNAFNSNCNNSTMQKCFKHVVMINEKLQGGALSSVQQGVAYSKSLLGTWVTQPTSKQLSAEPSDSTSPNQSSKKPSRLLGVIPTSLMVSTSPTDQVQLTEMTTLSNEKL